MNRTEWAQQLAEVIRPTAAKAAATQIGQLMRFMADVPAAAFTEQSVAYVAERKGSHALNLMWLRGVLQDYLAQGAPPPQPTALDDLDGETRAAVVLFQTNPSGMDPAHRLSIIRRYHPRAYAWLIDHDAQALDIATSRRWIVPDLQRDWDNPAGILRRIEVCQGDMRLLRMLAQAVGQYAPQHIGLMPPRVLAVLAADPEVRSPVFLEMRARGLFHEPERDAATQRDAMTGEYTRPRVIPNYLDPAYLDKINPLPNGRKRTDATIHTVPPPDLSAHTNATTPLDDRNPPSYPDHSTC